MLFTKELLEQDEVVEETTELDTQQDESVPVNTTAESTAVVPSTEEAGNDFQKRNKFSKWKKQWDRKDKRPRRQVEWKKEYEEKMLEVRRVTRVTTWWRQLSFRATMLIGNKNWKVGLWIAKWNDVQTAVSKATHDAYKNVVEVSITKDGTVPYPMVKKFRAAVIKLVPAKPGTGLKAWSSVRSVLELAGYTNMLSKIVGTNNVLNNALLAIDMVSKYKNFTIRFKEKVKELDAEPAETTESAE